MCATPRCVRSRFGDSWATCSSETPSSSRYWRTRVPRATVSAMTTALKRSFGALTLTLGLTGCNTPAFQAGLAYGRGTAQLNAGQYEAAIESFNRALQFDSDLAVAYNDRGLAKYQLHR